MDQDQHPCQGADSPVETRIFFLCILTHPKRKWRAHAEFGLFLLVQSVTATGNINLWSNWKGKFTGPPFNLLVKTTVSYGFLEIFPRTFPRWHGELSTYHIVFFEKYTNTRFHSQVPEWVWPKIFEHILKMTDRLSVCLERYPILPAEECNGIISPNWKIYCLSQFQFYLL